MKALVYDRYGPPEVLRLIDRPMPMPGPGVERLRPGAEVVLAILHGENGTAAEHVLCKPGQLAGKPAGLSHIETAALIQGGVTAWACLIEAARISRGEHVLVHGGAGAVGGACVELARHLGAHVSASCRCCDLELVRGLGADAAYAFDVPGEVERAVDQDVVIDTIGGVAHARSYSLLRRGGRLVTVNALPIVNRGAEHGVEVIKARIDDRADVLDAVARLAEQGVLRPRVGAVLPLDEAAQAHRIVERGNARGGRVVLSVRGEQRG